jgi:hypothetical protein
MFRAECPTCKTSYPIKPEVRGGQQVIMVCALCRGSFIVNQRMGSFAFPRVEVRKHGSSEH